MNDILKGEARLAMIEIQTMLTSSGYAGQDMWNAPDYVLVQLMTKIIVQAAAMEKILDLVEKEKI